MMFVALLVRQYLSAPDRSHFTTLGTVGVYALLSVAVGLFIWALVKYAPASWKRD